MQGIGATQLTQASNITKKYFGKCTGSSETSHLLSLKRRQTYLPQMTEKKETQNSCSLSVSGLTQSSNITKNISKKVQGHTKRLSCLCGYIDKHLKKHLTKTFKGCQNASPAIYLNANFAWSEHIRSILQKRFWGQLEEKTWKNCIIEDFNCIIVDFKKQPFKNRNTTRVPT